MERSDWTLQWFVDDAIEELKRKTQSFEDQVTSKDAALKSRGEQFNKVSHTCRVLEQKLRRAEDRNRDMALKVKKKQEEARDAEERAREFEAFHNAVAAQLQLAEEKVAVASEVPVRVVVSTQTEEGGG